mgnify:CR=1 FL=1
MFQALIQPNLNLLRFAAEAEAPEANPVMGILTLLFPLIMLGVLYFIMIRPQRKQEKKLAEQRKNLIVGDEVVSIGGVKGRVVNIIDDDITISTSVAGTLVTFTRDAIGQVLTPKTDDV